MSDSFEMLDATAQAKLVADGQVTPRELVESAIRRIEARDRALNAVIHPRFEKALEEAESPDLGSGPFRGVPFIVKDAVCHTAGDPYHVGTRFLKELAWTADSDSELARRFRAAGFVFVGKSNTPELASSSTTEPLAYGATRNPWNRDHSTGGSSGGSAAAVASRMVAAAHGNDMAGSIRIPASCCGLVGLKPTRARNSLAPAFGEYWGPLTHEHVLTRSVRDTAAILDATAGPAPGDPYLAPPPARPWREEVGVDPGRLRIGYRTRPPIDLETDAEVVEGVERAAKLLESLGHHVEEVAVEALDAASLIGGMGIILVVSLARDLDRWSTAIGREIKQADVEPMTWRMARQGRGISGAAYLACIEGIQSASRALARFWEPDGFDLLLTPTTMRPPAKLGYLAPDAGIEALSARLIQYAAFTAPFNCTGQPAISLPLHQTSTGLPVGVQLVAAYAREDLLIRVASQLESAAPWPSLPEDLV